MERWRTTFIISALAMAASLCTGGCDEIYETPPSPFIDMAHDAEAPKKDLMMESHQLTMVDLEGWRFFLVSNYQACKAEVDDNLSLREQGKPDEPKERYYYSNRAPDLLRRLEYKTAQVPLANKRYPDGHPARILLMASRDLEDWLRHTIRVFGRDMEYDPAYGQRFEESMANFDEAMKDFDPEDL